MKRIFLTSVKKCVIMSLGNGIFPQQNVFEEDLRMCKKVLALLLSVLLVFSAAGCSGSAPEPSSSVPSSQSESGSSVSSAPESSDLETGEPLEDDAGNGSSENGASDNDQVSTESIAALIELALPKEYTGKEVLYDDTSITINVWIDGVADGLTTIQAGGLDKGSWEDAKSGMIELAKACRELIDTAGRTDVILTVNVLNDQNLDNMLLSIENTSVLYDVLA